MRTPDSPRTFDPLFRSRMRRGRPLGASRLVIDTRASHGWYDFSVLISGSMHFEKRFAGRVETGVASISDPSMGRLV